MGLVPSAGASLEQISAPLSQIVGRRQEIRGAILRPFRRLLGSEACLPTCAWSHICAICSTRGSRYLWLREMPDAMCASITGFIVEVTTLLPSWPTTITVQNYSENAKRPFTEVQTINPGAYATGYNETMAETAFKWMDDTKNFTKRSDMQAAFQKIFAMKRDPGEVIEQLVKIVPSDVGEFRNIILQFQEKAVARTSKLSLTHQSRSDQARRNQRKLIEKRQLFTGST